MICQTGNGEKREGENGERKRESVQRSKEQKRERYSLDSYQKAKEGNPHRQCVRVTKKTLQYEEGCLTGFLKADCIFPKYI